MNRGAPSLGCCKRRAIALRSCEWRSAITMRALTVMLVLSLSSSPARGALLPAVSEDLTGQPPSTFDSETLDGRRITSDELVRRPTIVNFFASWCTACQMEMAALRTLAPDLERKGFAIVGVLVDPIETPDTVDEARQGLARDPLPYPVLLMNPAVRDAFHYEGFPATYFITHDGLFGTTLLGFHAGAELEQVATQLSTGTSPGGATREVAAEVPASAPRHHEWEKAPLRALVPGNWQEWHPLVVHFPIALLVLEAVALATFWSRRSTEAARVSSWCLSLAVLTLVPTVFTGIRDDGAALGAGSAFWNGVHDRLGHLLRLESSISVHVLFMIGVVGLATLRLCWRSFAGERVLVGIRGLVFAALTLAGVWLLFGGAQVGGGISHP